MTDRTGVASEGEHSPNAPGPHLVAVNNDAEFLALLRFALHVAGYTVTTVIADEAFALIAALRPRAIIVDLSVRETAGWRLLELLRATPQLRATPVLVTATRASDLATVEGDPARYAGDRFLTKPFDRAELLTAVQTLIGPA